MTAITVNLSDDVLEKLQTQAKDRHMALEAYIEATLLDVVTEEDLTDEEILANIKISLKQAISGQTMSWDDTMTLLRQEFMADVHED